ncbi:MAG: hypothetical protein JXJ04_11360 [Spirochaetales bacterium]|nr:hypothetical protein [Spirochaetales bacterium]
MKKIFMAVICLLLASVVFAQGKYLPGDFHQHTFYTDGANTFFKVMKANSDYGLDWWANSEHGGSRNRDGNGDNWDDPQIYPVLPVLGDAAYSGGKQVMWRWQSLRYYVYPDVVKARTVFSEKTILSGLEWNVPSHEHCSTGIYQYGGTAAGISEFEYRFDASDKDTSRDNEVSLLTGFNLLSKTNKSKEDAILAVQFMQAGKDQGLWDAYVVPAHIERARKFLIEDFRNWNNAGPDVAFGFEGAPGHQASGDRGFGRSAFGDGTYGGSGYFCAKVGGLWDAILGEGRNWWNFASSDFHNHWSDGGSDFWPGEYQKNYVSIDTSNPDKQQAVFDALRSGNSYHVEGDLITDLSFIASSGKSNKAAMGQTLIVNKGDLVRISITVTDPAVPNNCPLDMLNPSLENIGIRQPLSEPELDHVDLISGDVTGYVAPDDPLYTADENPSASVIKTFKTDDRGKKNRGHGFSFSHCRFNNTYTFHYVFRADKDRYFRLRGTNLPANVPLETDTEGNPLADSEANDGYYASLDPVELEAKLFKNVTINTNSKLDEVAEAYADLWFYSNPVFIDVVE